MLRGIRRLPSRLVGCSNAANRIGPASAVAVAVAVLGAGLASYTSFPETLLLTPIQRQLMAGGVVLVLLAAGGVLLVRSQSRRARAELVKAKLQADAAVASRVVAEAETKLTMKQLQVVADKAPFLLAFLDPNLIFRFANSAHVLWFQRPLDEIIGKPINALVDQPLAADYLEAMEAALATDRPQTILHERSWIGKCKSVELTLAAQLDDSGQLEGYCLTARDAPDEALREQTLHLASRRDPLTGLCNRTAFIERLKQGLGIADFEATLLTVAYLDIDHFKQVNDQFGRGVGDQLLKELGRRMKAVLRPADTVARLDGDMIALIMRFKAPEDVRIVGSRLLQRIREPFVIGEHRISATASIGFAIAIPGDTIPTLLKRVETALDEVKDSGRDDMIHAEVPDAPLSTMHDLTCQ